MEVEAISSDNGGAKKDNASAVDQTEVRRKSVTPQLASPMLNPLADIDLAEFSLLEVLTQAATDVLGSIPAQRCIVYVYDKAANLLRPQVVVDCNDTDTTDPDVKPNEVSTPIEPINEAPHQPADEVTTTTSMAERMSYNVTKSPLVSFPPVVGMVSSSFLQRRCLRMQEPNPHRTFHREYDVPKDMQVDSILCAPVILYRRATGVIQLINHVDVTAERSLFEETERAATPQDLRNESSSEVRLRRLKTIKAMMNTGFSAKDEQKLLHFTTHVAVC
ncbi:hypothetical protein KRP22_007624 [Phytophthora ramorum]|nr:hypothetical protein KRP22_4364 [Phytophthora ramorum]